MQTAFGLGVPGPLRQFRIGRRPDIPRFAYVMQNGQLVGQNGALLIEVL
ncbi:hypothetical protein [Marinovum sp.]|nr:hypothetical protein [Marinovum sp.]